MPHATATPIRHRFSRRLPRAPRMLSCAVHGHRWDVAPGFLRGSQLECVRCGLRTDAMTGVEH